MRRERFIGSIRFEPDSFRCCRTLEAEGSEAPQPPPELRRPPSARVPRPAHSPSTQDRLISKFLIFFTIRKSYKMYNERMIKLCMFTVYGSGCGRSPPPAHTSGAARGAGALPPGAAPGPPHASQVPREADSLQMLLRVSTTLLVVRTYVKRPPCSIHQHSSELYNFGLAKALVGTFSNFV